MSPTDNDEDRLDVTAPRQASQPIRGDDEPRSDERRRALDRMVEIAEEAGMYECAVSPKRTR